MDTSLLLACDLDRTVIPNGVEPLSEGALELFVNFVAQPQVTLTYATGRHLSSIHEVIRQYDLPLPDIIVADVGTSIYWRKDGQFVKDIIWESKLAENWNNQSVTYIQSLVEPLTTDNFILQEPEKQSSFKLSYYTPENINEVILLNIKNALVNNNIQAEVVFSTDVVGKFGYLDILPAVANKAQALEYLQHKLSLSKKQTVFAGDSGTI